MTLSRTNKQQTLQATASTRQVTPPPDESAIIRKSPSTNSSRKHPIFVDMDMSGSFISSIHSATTLGLNRSISEGSIGSMLSTATLKANLIPMALPSRQDASEPADVRSFVLQQIGDMMDAQKLSISEATEALDLAMRKDDTHELMASLLKSRKHLQGKADFLRMWLSGRNRKTTPSPEKEQHRPPASMQPVAPPPYYYYPPYHPHWQPPAHQQFQQPQFSSNYYYQGPMVQQEEDGMQHPVALRGSTEDSMMSSHTVVQKPPGLTRQIDAFGLLNYGYSPAASPSPGLVDPGKVSRGYTPNPSPQLSTRSSSPLGCSFPPPKAPSKSNGEVYFAPVRNN